MRNPRSSFVTLLTIALSLASSGLAGCGGGTRACKQGTLFVTIELGGTSSTADQLQIDVSIDGATPKSSTRTRVGHGTTETQEVDFPNGYPVGKRIDVYVTGMRNGSPIASAVASLPALPAGCGTLTVAFNDVGPGTGGAGGSAGRGGGAGTGTGGNGGSAGGSGGSVSGAGGRGGAGGTGVVIPNRNVDILVMVDNSTSMMLSQNKLNSSFASFVSALRASPQGLPNLHLAVVSSDMGAGDGSIAQCDATRGDNGLFQNTPRGTCTSSGLQTGAMFISDVGGTKNYTGNMETVFSCIAALGEQGCGFEHQFASILRALGADDALPPLANQGFLRQDALLAIVLLTNEDDCSASFDALYDTTANLTLDSQLGPPASFRCNEFGHLCNNGSGTFMHPNRHAPGNNVSATVNYVACTSDDQGGFLLSVADTASRLKALKIDPSMVMVAALTGAASPYTVTWKPPSISDTSCGATSCPWPVIAHSCTGTDGSFADPAVRIGELANQFGANGLVQSLCADNFGPALERIANMILARLTP
ncbi:MAG TPA: hypothetical protein VN903_13700 [Polyangia bacterium]|jgi:hypothetical protein|nr:hypothetical protein [Polyangia bacterium]